MDNLESLRHCNAEILTVNNTLITIFCNSQKTFTTIRQPFSQKENRFFRGQIYYKAKKLKTNGYMVVCRWILGHTDLLGNKKADLAVRNKAEKGGKQAESWSLFVYIKKNLARCASQRLPSGV